MVYMGVTICAEQVYDIEIALSSIAAKMMQHEKNHQPNTMVIDNHVPKIRCTEKNIMLGSIFAIKNILLK